MNIIQEKRQEILKENNTANSFIENYLSSMKDNRSKTTLSLNEKLSGEIDLSILKESGFNNVRELIFLKDGEVTSIINIPNSIEQIKCNNQLLTELNFRKPLPNLKTIECTGNYLTTIDLLNTPNLIELNLSNNKLESVENIPRKIEKIILDNNYIKRIQLTNLEQLHTFHISNNKTVIIEGLPKTVADFVSENNPYIEVVKGDDETSKKKAFKKMNYIEILDEFFKLKKKYEENLKKQKHSLYDKFKKKGMQKQGKKAIKTIIAKCANCNQKGGTVFQKKDGVYTAYCNNKQTPCDLKLEIVAEQSYNNEDDLELYENGLKQIEQEIIILKLQMELKFNTYNNSFKNSLEERTEIKKQYDFLLKKHQEIYYDDERMNKINKKIITINEIIFEINKIIEEYIKTQNKDVLKMAIEMQINELNPEIHNLRQLKYEIMEMTKIEKRSEGDDDIIKTNGINYLFQRTVSL